MRVRIDANLKKELLKIQKKDLKLTKKIEKQLIIFSQNPKHPSLRTHKLSGKLQNMWSISITRSIRMAYLLFEDEALFYDIGTHDEVYKK